MSSAVTSKGKKRIEYISLLKNLKERDYLEDLGISRRIVFNGS
jgi:hypothetical protein